MESIAAVLAGFAIIGLFGGGVLVAVVIGTVLSARRRAWRFDLGRVIGNMGTAIGRAPAAFFGGALLLIGVPNAALYAAAGVLPGGAEPDYFAGGVELLGLPLGITLILATVAMSVLLGTIAQLVMVGAGVEALEAQDDAAGVLGTAIVLAVPAIVMSIVMGIAYVVGLMLLVIPGLVLLALWAVAMPVLVRERLGVFESLGRSAELSEGARWAILLLVLLAIVASMVIAGVFEGIAEMVGGYPGLGLSAIGTALSSVIGPALAVGIYHELRTQKEVAGAGELESVFE